MSFQNGNEFAKNGKNQDNPGAYYLGNRFSGALPDNSGSGELLDIKKFLSLFLNHKWVILFFILCGVGLAVYLAENTTPVYRSMGTMYISSASQSNGGGSADQSGGQISQMIASQYGMVDDGSIAMQVEFIKSRKLTDEVARQMMNIKYRPDGTLYPILWEDYPTDSSLVSLGTLSGRIRGGLSVSQQESKDGFTIPGMVEISFSSYDPYEASRIVNMIMNTYVEMSLKQNRAVAHGVNEFLDKQKEKAKEALLSSEDDLSRFMNQKKMVSLDQQSNQLVTTLSQLESQRQAIDVKQVALNTAIKSYKEQLESIKPGLADKIAQGSGTTLNSYQYQLASLQTQKSLILSQNPGLKKNPDSEPEVRKIDQRISVLKSEISKLTSKIINQGDDLGISLGTSNGNILSEISTLRQKVIELQIQKDQNAAQAKALDDQISLYKEQFNKVPDNMMELARLKRKVQMNQDLYTTLSQQSAQMTLNEQLQSSQGHIIDSASRPISPIIPNKPLIIVIGLFMGLMFPVGFLFVREITDNRINSVEKLKKRGLPVLSIIPEMTGEIRKLFSRQKHISVDGFKVSTYLLTHLEAISPVTESFRRMQSNVIYSQPDSELKVLMVTSSHKGEGKSTVLSNFAVLLAEAGRRVLIVDADFRRPGISKIFGVNGSPGILENLFEDVGLHEVIQKSSVEGVDVLAAGKLAPNPASLSKSGRFRQLILNLKDKYDHILIDTAPYGMITDAAPLIHLTDGVILVTKFNDTKTTELDQTIETLRHTRAYILGVVLTSYNPKRSTDYYYNKKYYKTSYSEYEKYHDGRKARRKQQKNTAKSQNAHV